MSLKNIIEGAYLVPFGVAIPCCSMGDPNSRSWTRGFLARHRLCSMQSGSLDVLSRYAKKGMDSSTKGEFCKNRSV